MNSAESSIRGICEAPLRDHRALYACVLEAHNFGSEVETLRALKHVLKHMDNLPVDSIHKPAALRLVTVCGFLYCFDKFFGLQVCYSPYNDNH